MATPRGERIEISDALRGFALLGILLANAVQWSGWILMTESQRVALAGGQGVAAQYGFHHLLIDGKFYTIFSLLFGAGFALQLARLSARGFEGMRLYRRRVLILFAIGLVHSRLVLDGDILTLYALLGLALPWFHRWSERALLWTAAGMILASRRRAFCCWPPPAGSPSSLSTPSASPSPKLSEPIPRRVR